MNQLHSTHHSRLSHSAQECYNPEETTLLDTQLLPEPICRIFARYTYFNEIQTASFENIFQSDDNVVISAPTGSGKTCLFELAICRLIYNNPSSGSKIIYMAPTKALCSERFRDWSTKFQQLNLRCGELTGDTNLADMPIVKESDIIITTPEKWDSISRHWRDSRRLVQMIRLFLIDEVHMLKEKRGAILEVVVSRMKQVSTKIRFVALSATVPNIGDVASWLRLSDSQQNWPAQTLSFGEQFRPVQIERFVYGFPKSEKMNDFAFDATLTKQVYSLLTKHAECKPVIVFCSTRKDALRCAKEIASAYNAAGKSAWQMSQIAKNAFKDKDLNELASTGVAFHHAGLDAADRSNVEKLFLAGSILVITSTSTLAVGINLPAHLVILKNTLTYVGGSFEEYSDLEILQMIGRAGRPQFDDSGIAVIMTDQKKVQMYESLISGTETLESSLHTNLLEHINAEIGLGTFTDVAGAILWLKSTFLYVRIKQNPGHYRISDHMSKIDDTLEELCKTNIESLTQNDLVHEDEHQLRVTPFGNAMAKYYIRFETMRVILSLPWQASNEQILIAACKAEELTTYRFRTGEKPFYNELKKNKALRFTYEDKTNEVWQKIMLLAQLDMCSINFIQLKDKYKDVLNNIAIHKASIRLQLLRLLACIIDCKLESKDAISVYNALELRRSIAAKCLDNHPSMLKQLVGIGDGSLKTLISAGINCFERLADTDPRELERIFKRNPPFGNSILRDLASFPNLSLEAHIESSRRTADGAEIFLRVHLGCSNKPRTKKGGQQHHIILLVDTGKGLLVDFRRHSIVKILEGHDWRLKAQLKAFTRNIRLRIMCEELVGSMAEYSLPVPFRPEEFPETDVEDENNSQLLQQAQERVDKDMPMAERWSDYVDIFDDDEVSVATASLSTQSRSCDTGRPSRRAAELDAEIIQPVILSNGNFACNHTCRDKMKCAHVCCKTGRPKPNAKERATLQISAIRRAKQSSSDCSVQNLEEDLIGTDHVATPIGTMIGPQRAQICHSKWFGSSQTLPRISDMIDLSAQGPSKQDIESRTQSAEGGLEDPLKTGSPQELVTEQVLTATQKHLADAPFSRASASCVPRERQRPLSQSFHKQDDDDYGWDQDQELFDLPFESQVQTQDKEAQRQTSALFLPTSPETPRSAAKQSTTGVSKVDDFETAMKTPDTPTARNCIRVARSSDQTKVRNTASVVVESTTDVKENPQTRVSSSQKLLGFLGNCFYIEDEEPAELQGRYSNTGSLSHAPARALSSPCHILTSVVDEHDRKRQKVDLSTPRMLQGISNDGAQGLPKSGSRTRTVSQSPVPLMRPTAEPQSQSAFARLFEPAQW